MSADETHFSAGVDLAPKLEPLDLLVWGCCKPQALVSLVHCSSLKISSARGELTHPQLAFRARHYWAIGGK